MAQINISNTGTSGIESPQTGVVAIFSNSADSGKLYYKFSDGSISPVDTGGGGGSGSSGTSGTSGAQGPAGTSGVAGTSGTSGTSGAQGPAGTSGVAGTSGTSGVAGTSGTSGVAGTSGTSGVAGTSGTSGQGIPTGGTSGQVLAKINSTDYNTEWVDQSGGGGGGGATAYAIRINYDTNSDPDTSSQITTSPYSSNTVTVALNAVNDVTFQFGSESQPPLSVTGYFYNANTDKYAVSTFGLGSNGYEISSALSSTISSNQATNTFFSSFSSDNLKFDLTPANYGGAKKNLPPVFIHVYMVFTFA